jgi:hypothetical protein
MRKADESAARSFDQAISGLEVAHLLHRVSPPARTLQVLFCLKHYSGGSLAVSGMGGFALWKKLTAPLVVDVSDHRAGRRDTGFRRNRRHCDWYREDSVLRVSGCVASGFVVGSTLDLKTHASPHHVRLRMSL